MKSTVLTGLLFLLTAAIAHAQLSFLPQIGFEQSRTALNYGDAGSTAGIDGNLKGSLKVGYQFKGGHTPFINLGTSPAPMNFVFDNAGSLVNSYQAAKNNLKFRMEAGYQYTSSPIQFGKKSSASKSYNETKNRNTEQKKSCGSTNYRSHCGEKKMNFKNKQSNNFLNMRLQPSLALAYIPSTTENIKTTNNGFEYNANWKTAIVPAMGFQFAKGQQKLFTLTVFYTKPLGNNDETVTTYPGIKNTVTQLNSKVSTWGMTVGVPFSFTKANVTKVKKEKKECIKSCYRRCSRLS